jgi:hypothetical protein
VEPGARGRLELTPATPWTLRLFDRIPLAPIWVGCGIGLSLFALFLVVSYLFGSGLGRFDALPHRNTWAPELIMTALIGLVPAATVYSVRGALRDLEALRAALGCSNAEYGELRREITSYPRWVLLGVGSLSVAGSVGWVFSRRDLWVGGLRPPLTDAAFLWLGLRNAVDFWMISRAIAFQLVFARAFSKLGERLASIELLNRAPLAPFGRRALRGVLGWMLLVALYSLLYVGD